MSIFVAVELDSKRTRFLLMVSAVMLDSTPQSSLFSLLGTIGTGICVITWWCLVIGISKRKVDPLPSPSEWTLSRPPCISTIAFDINNPNPLPPPACNSSGLNCIISLNNRFWFSGLIPAPLSFTTITNIPLLTDFNVSRLELSMLEYLIAKVMFPPEGVNLIAFDIRLRKTWPNLLLSTEIVSDFITVSRLILSQLSSSLSFVTESFVLNDIVDLLEWLVTTELSSSIAVLVAWAVVSWLSLLAVDWQPSFINSSFILLARIWISNMVRYLEMKSNTFTSLLFKVTKSSFNLPYSNKSFRISRDTSFAELISTKISRRLFSVRSIVFSGIWLIHNRSPICTEFIGVLNSCATYLVCAAFEAMIWSLNVAISSFAIWLGTTQIITVTMICIHVGISKVTSCGITTVISDCTSITSMLSTK